jgi:hypothetical protein
MVIFPTGRFKIPSPLGHSGHDKLHRLDVSIDTLVGIPKTMGIFSALEKAKPNPQRIRFIALRKVKYDMKSLNSLILNLLTLAVLQTS